MNNLIIILVFFFFHTNFVFAENPYIREGSIGKQIDQADAASKGDFQFRPVEKWVGEKFIFLPRPKSLQDYGYQSFEGGRGRHGHPTYEECVGRIGTIINATDREVTIKMDENGQIYRGLIFYGSVDGIASIADFNSARVKFLGRTLWRIRGSILTYDHRTEKYGTVDFKRYSPVKVVDIVVGWDTLTPARFILKTPSGAEGFIDVNLSGTNVPSELRDRERFDDWFLVEDPRKTHRWGEKVWAAIEEGKVFVGMTAEQARMSWGKPKEINRTVTMSARSEQWVYGNGNYLYFEDGILRSIQN